MKKMIRGLLAGLVALAMGGAQGGLVNRGGGMIYDDVLNVTWLEDANYLSTQFDASGGAIGDADGFLSWYDAKSWADNLSYEVYTDWRLPRVRPVNGISFQYFYARNDGSTDIGYNIGAPNSNGTYFVSDA